MPPLEHHKTGRVGWLRAAVLGANDGIVSTASLIIGVAASNADRSSIFIAGLAGLVAGAMSMAAGEYVSVHTQADTEKADLKMEAEALAADPKGELKELTAIYIERGLTPNLADEVARQLTAHNALHAHARDEIGITEHMAARPLQAAIFSAVSFALGAALPLLVAVFSRTEILIYSVAVGSLVFLSLLGAAAARAGGANMIRGAVRVLFWGAIAMAITALIGNLFGTTVA